MNAKHDENQFLFLDRADGFFAGLASSADLLELPTTLSHALEHGQGWKGTIAMGAAYFALHGAAASKALGLAKTASSGADWHRMEKLEKGVLAATACTKAVLYFAILPPPLGIAAGLLQGLSCAKNAVDFFGALNDKDYFADPAMQVVGLGADAAGLAASTLALGGFALGEAGAEATMRAAVGAALRRGTVRASRIGLAGLGAEAAGLMSKGFKTILAWGGPNGVREFPVTPDTVHASLQQLRLESTLSPWRLPCAPLTFDSCHVGAW